ncbi:heterokaryon incompatibility protein-domain-containing protein [Halenospora varia]|nr:heterokaryon incompatibility protein-domain-containing protein [Halenospora varia]
MHRKDPKGEMHDPGHSKMHYGRSSGTRIRRRAKSLDSIPESMLESMPESMPESTQHRVPTPYTSSTFPTNSHLPQYPSHQFSLDRPNEAYRKDTPRFNKSTPSLPQKHPNHLRSAPLHPALEVLRSQVYQYKPLLEHSGFRLVEISQGDEAMITCRISHESLTEPPSYVAISYAWGDPRPTRKIIVNDSVVFVAASIHGALRVLREEALYDTQKLGQQAKPLRVWADALCINQQNEDERAHQVRLMTDIYSKAKSVAVYLGKEDNDSTLAIHLLSQFKEAKPLDVSRLTEYSISQGIAAIVGLFERDYWRRLWVVQEISNAKFINVYCGTLVCRWDLFTQAPQIFGRIKDDLERFFPASRRNGSRRAISLNQFSYSQVLIHQGPGSLSNLSEKPLLEVLRACRSKLASDAKDKVFGVLGVLHQVRQEFLVDYKCSVKDVYTNVVKYILKGTKRLDVICEAINFPTYTGSANLPSYVPDWSHIPQMAAMGDKYGFSAASQSDAHYRFFNAPSDQLEISAIYLGTIGIHGIAVGTLCTLETYLMTFLHWRARLLEFLENDDDEDNKRVQDDFCRTLSLGQVPKEFDNSTRWLTVCYILFTSLLSKRLPKLPLDEELRTYINAEVSEEFQFAAQFIQENFGNRMMGRCFCCTEEGDIGMGCGSMLPGDVVVVPFGCSTPIILRPEGISSQLRYRFVGDIYIHGYMYGQAVVDYRNGERQAREYVLN